MTGPKGGTRTSTDTWVRNGNTVDHTGNTTLPNGSTITRKSTATHQGNSVTRQATVTGPKGNTSAGEGRWRRQPGQPSLRSTPSTVQPGAVNGSVNSANSVQRPPKSRPNGWSPASASNASGGDKTKYRRLPPWRNRNKGQNGSNRPAISSQSQGNPSPTSARARKHTPAWRNFRSQNNSVYRSGRNRGGPGAVNRSAGASARRGMPARSRMGGRRR